MQLDLWEIFCTRCGCPRPKAEHPCPECRCPEFSLGPTVTTDGWRKRDAGTHPAGPTDAGAGG
jgi:hypothetical protein